MRQISVIILLLGLIVGAWATDYRLSVSATSDQLLKAKTLRVYGFDFAKGDRVVSVDSGFEGSGTGYRVVIESSGGSGTMLADQHGAEGFGGKIFAGSGNAPSKAVSASVVAVPPPLPADAGLLATAKGFLLSPIGLIATGILLLAAGLGLFYRPRGSGEHPALPNRRKAIDEALKDISRRLEQIDANQHELVKKPPVLRSFKSTIDNFDARLKHLEGQLQALQNHSSKANETLSALNQGEKDIKSTQESLYSSLESARQGITYLNAAVEKQAQQLTSRADEILSNNGKQALETQNLIAGLEKEAADSKAQLAATIEELRGSMDVSGLDASVSELRASLDAIAARVTDLTKGQGHAPAAEAALAELRTLFDGLQAGQNQQRQEIEQLTAAMQDRGAAETEQAVAALANANEAVSKKLAELSGQIEDLAGSRDANLLETLQGQHAMLESELAKLNEKLQTLSDSANADADKQLAGLGEKLAAVEKLLADNAAALDAKIAEIAERTDQRESILLSLQTQAAAAEGQSGGAAEVLPLVADLKLELRTLATEQVAVGAAVEKLAQVVGDASDKSKAKIDDLSAVQARFEEALNELRQSLNKGGSESASAFQGALQSLSDSLSSLRSESDEQRKALQDQIDALTSRAPSGNGGSVGEEDRAMMQAGLEELTRTLAEWKAEAERSHTALDERLANEVAKREREQEQLKRLLDSQPAAATEHAPVPVAAGPAPAPANSLQPEAAAAKTAVAAEARKPEPKPAPAPQVIASESSEDFEEIDAAQLEWNVLGASQARRWSAAVAAQFKIESNDQSISPVTPTITASTDFRIGPVLCAGKKIVYGHGPNLQADWPGKNPQVVSLQESIPEDAWRLAALDGNIFCAEEDQVEIVNLASSRVASRFSGTMIDQVRTDTAWVGLATSLGQLHLDYRNLLGRQLGGPVKLPVSEEEAKAMAADGEKVFVAARDGRILKVDLGNVEEICAAGPKGLEVVSMSVHKGALLVVVRSKGHDSVRLVGFDGKVQKELALEFSHDFDHPVLIGEKLYLVDSSKQSIVAFGLKKLDLAGTVALPQPNLLSFCGFYRGEQHGLAVVTAAKDRTNAKLHILDPKSGATMLVTDLNEPNVNVLAADSKLIVATSSNFQNVIRVFDPFRASQALKAA